MIGHPGTVNSESLTAEETTSRHPARSEADGEAETFFQDEVQAVVLDAVMKAAHKEKEGSPGRLDQVTP